MDAISWFAPEKLEVTLGEGELPLPIRLQNEGYDVWLANMRGTRYSRKHTSLDPSDISSDYWKFSWAEKGMLDIPAAIKKVKETSGVEKVAYIGYSQGTTIMFYALTKEVEESFFADNVSGFIALAPCMIPQQALVSYDNFIATDWQALDNYPNLFDENFDIQGYCNITSNAGMCQWLQMIDTNSVGQPTVDTRSFY